MRSAQLTEQTVHRDTQTSIDRMRELEDDITASKARRTCIAAVCATHLNVAVDHGCHHAIADTLAVRHITHDIISLVSCHAIAVGRVDTAVGRANHVSACILIEDIRGRANLRLQACLRNLIENRKHLSVLRETIMLRAYQLVYIILPAATGSTLKVLRHQSTETYYRLVALEYLDTAVGCNLSIIPGGVICCLLHRTTCAHTVEVGSIQGSTLGIHQYQQQFVELVIAPHIRIISIGICVLILCLMNRLQRRYILTRITCSTRLEHLLQQSVRSAVRTYARITDDTMSLSALIASQLAVGGIKGEMANGLSSLAAWFCQ